MKPILNNRYDFSNGLNPTQHHQYRTQNLCTPALVSGCDRGCIQTGRYLAGQTHNVSAVGVLLEVPARVEQRMGRRLVPAAELANDNGCTDDPENAFYWRFVEFGHFAREMK